MNFKTRTKSNLEFLYEINSQLSRFILTRVGKILVSIIFYKEQPFSPISKVCKNFFRQTSLTCQKRMDVYRKELNCNQWAAWQLIAIRIIIGMKWIKWSSGRTTANVKPQFVWTCYLTENDWLSRKLEWIYKIKLFTLSVYPGKHSSLL